MIPISLSKLLPILFVAIAFIPALIVILIMNSKKKSRRTSVAGNVLRSPGESLRLIIEDFDDKINESLFFLFSTPPALCAAYIAQSQFTNKQPGNLVIITLVLLVLVVLYLYIKKLYLLLQIRHTYRVGLDAELAVGQELNYLMLEGFQVFHDFPQEQNNIDHIAIGPAGVFAIETRGILKPETGKGAAAARLIYDGQSLIFPDKHKISEPIAQARKQAAALAEWLGSVIDEPVDVQAALALPGWVVERKKQDGFVLLSGRKKDFLQALKDRKGEKDLSDELIRQIAHHLSEKCRRTAQKADAP
jgi:hypothetical protein